MEKDDLQGGSEHPGSGVKSYRDISETLEGPISSVALGQELNIVRTLRFFGSVFAFWIQGIEPNALCMLGMCSTTELHPQLSVCLVFFLFRDRVLLSCPGWLELVV
jgi:hypothetical protein